MRELINILLTEISVKGIKYVKVYKGERLITSGQLSLAPGNFLIDGKDFFIDEIHTIRICCNDTVIIRLFDS